MCYIIRRLRSFYINIQYAHLNKLAKPQTVNTVLNVSLDCFTARH